MDPNYRAMIDFLRGLGTEDVSHSGDKGFLAHLVSVFRDLEKWGCDRAFRGRNLPFVTTETP
jgi:hypothetical protein